MSVSVQSSDTTPSLMPEQPGKRKPRPSFWCSNFKDDAVMQGLVIAKPTNSPQKEDRQPNRFESHSAGVMSAATAVAQEHQSRQGMEQVMQRLLPVRREKAPWDQKQAVDMVHILREVLGVTCGLLRDAQRSNECLERKCSLYDAHIKRLDGGASKSGIAKVLLPGPLRGPPNGQAFVAEPTRKKIVEEVVANGAAQAASPGDQKVSYASPAKAKAKSGVVAQRRGEEPQDSDQDLAVEKPSSEEQEQLRQRLALVGLNEAPKALASAAPADSSTAPRLQFEDSNVGMVAENCRPRAGTANSARPRAGTADGTPKNVSFKAATPSSASEASFPSSSSECSGSEMHESLTPMEVRTALRQFEQVRMAMRDDEFAEEEIDSLEVVTPGGSVQESSIRRASVQESDEGLVSPRQSSLCAGRSSLIQTREQFLATMNLLAEVEAEKEESRKSLEAEELQPDKKSDFFAGRRTAISVNRKVVETRTSLVGLEKRMSALNDAAARGSDPDVVIGDGGVFFSGRRTAVSISSSSGGRYSDCFKRPSIQEAPDLDEIPERRDSCDSTRQRDSTASTASAVARRQTKRLNFSRGADEEKQIGHSSSTPQRRLTLFKGGKKPASQTL